MSVVELDPELGWFKFTHPDAPYGSVRLLFWTSNSDQLVETGVQLYLLASLGVDLADYLRVAGEWPPPKRRR